MHAAPRGQAGCPTSSSSGSRKSGTTALHHMLRAPPPDLHAREQGAVVLRRPSCTNAHRRDPPGRRSSLAEYCALFAAAGPEQRVGEASVLYLWSHTAAQRDRRGRTRRAHRSRSCASPPACCARCTCSSWRPTSRPARPAHGARARATRASGRDDAAPTPTGRRRSLYSEHVRYVEQLEPLSRALRPRADAGADLRGLPAPTTLATVRPGAALPAGRRHGRAARRAEANPTVSVRSQRLHELVHALYGRARAALACREGGVEAGDAAAAAPRRRCARPRSGSCTPRRRRPTRR